MKLFTHAIVSIAIIVAGIFVLAGGLGVVMVLAGGTPTFAARTHLIPNSARLINGQTILPPDSYEPTGITVTRRSVSLARAQMTLVAYVHIASTGAVEFHGPTKGSAWANIYLTADGPTPDKAFVAAAVIFEGPMNCADRSCHSPGTQTRVVPAGWYFVTLSYSDNGGGIDGPQTGTPLSVTQNGRPLVPYWPAGH